MVVPQKEKMDALILPDKIAGIIFLKGIHP